MAKLLLRRKVAGENFQRMFLMDRFTVPHTEGYGIPARFGEDSDCSPGLRGLKRVCNHVYQDAVHQVRVGHQSR